MDCTAGLERFGFWVFLAVLVGCDYWLFSKGYDTFFQEHSTPEEKEIQRLKIGRLRCYEAQQKEQNEEWPEW